ncbi:ubiquinol-cytochrome c reductase iron-sulfur subunit [Ornithinimicrobium panacihumi]|uniref:QcrA and Rieske domain-containing protein n=1 Tax=Ornithinimicrobium panacihumi TaxID=2008449 RepID=UPI003F88AD43
MNAGPGRRTVLRAAGAVAVTTPLLSACGGSSGSSGAATTGPDGAVRLDVGGMAVGESRYYRDARVILTRSSESDYVVFDQTCPHQGCAVSEVKEGKLLCPCHGSYFDPVSGDPVHGPAATALTVVPSSLEGTEIVLRG